nr:recQ-mediated genome instability protein 1-like [Onthophagus taurus]
MSLNDEIIRTKSYFQNLHIPLSDEWLGCCIKWLKEEKSSYTENEFKSAIYDQWLIFDLRKVKVPQLPPDVTKIEKLITKKPLVLQMMSIIDISKSQLQQLNQIRNYHALTRGFDEDENAQNKVTNNKGVLQMVLTDGVQEIKAFEYKPVDSLNLNLSPGIKIFINHPVTIRKGTIMLENHHVQLLGGEVEEILVSNAAENVLAQSLKLPINPKPRFINNRIAINQLITTIEPNLMESTSNISNVQNNFANNSINSEVNFNKNDKKPLEVTPNQIKSVSNKKITQTNTSNDITIKSDAKTTDYNEMDDLLSDEIDELLEIEQELLQETKIKTKSNENLKLQNDLSVQLQISDLTDEFFTPWNNENEDKIYTLPELKQLIAMNRHGTFKTFAKFKSVVKKLTVADSVGWVLQIKIEAENEELNVNVHDSVVTELVGNSSQEMLEMKKRVQMKDKEATSNVMKALENLRVKLQDLNSMMEIEYKGDEEDNVPFIVRIF